MPRERNLVASLDAYINRTKKKKRIDSEPFTPVERNQPQAPEFFVCLFVVVVVFGGQGVVTCERLITVKISIVIN